MNRVSHDDRQNAQTKSNFSLSIELDELSRDVSKAAVTQFKLFNGLAGSGAITMPAVADAAIATVKTLFRRFR